MRRILWLLLWAALAASAAPSNDNLSELPAGWEEILRPLPKQTLQGLDQSQVERIRETRAELSRALSDVDGKASERLAPAYGRLGALYAAQRLWSAAGIAFENAARLDPQGFRWAYYGVHLALEAGDAEQALRRLDRARRLDPDYPALALRRAEALLGLNRLDEAGQAYAAARELPGQRAAALYGLAQIDLLQRRWQAAAERLGEVLDLQPQADAAHYGLGQALLRLGRREEAKWHLAERGTRTPEYPDTLIEELESLQGGARHQFEQAMIAVNDQRHEAALDAFARGLERDPDNARARTSYARVLWLLGREVEAAEQLRRSLDADPEQTLARFLLAAIAEAEGRIEAAARGYREVLRLDPGHAGALSYLANLELRRGNAAAAAEGFRRAIELESGQPALRLHYWRALLESGAPQELLRDTLERFDQRYPEPPIYRLLLARLLATSPDPDVRDPERALRLAAELINAMPIAPHQGLLALALAANGKWEEAVERQALLVEHAGEAGSEAAEAFEADLRAYREQRMPERVWRLDHPMFQPLDVDVTLLMKNYPAAKPF